MAKHRKGYFFGTFNPVHNGHLMMATYLFEHTDIGTLYLVVSPDAPFKDTSKTKLVPLYQRCGLISQCTFRHNEPGKFTKQIHALDVEKDMPSPTYTSDTLDHIYSELHHNGKNKPVLVLGADNFIELAEGRFHNAQHIIDTYPIYVFPRDGYTKKAMELADKINSENSKADVFVLFGAPTTNVSSSFIRMEAAAGRDVRFYVPDKIADTVKYLYGPENDQIHIP